MGRVSTAFRAFFRSLFDAETAARVQEVLSVPTGASTQPDAPSTPAFPASNASIPDRKPAQSEAITLLATLQREARLIDFLKENLSAYSDEQVGAAVREIHRDSAKVLDRLFAIQSIMKDEEDAAVEVPAGFDAGKYRLTGQLTGAAPVRGTLRHRGWEATQCELPLYTGSESTAKTIAPAEIEIL